MKNISAFWAKLIGLYMLITCIGLFINLHQYQLLITEVSKNNGLVMMSGIFTLFLGLAIVVSHQVYKGWPILVTIIGYWACIKGVILLFYPNLVHHFATSLQHYDLRYTVIPSIIIGIILLYCGFCRSK